MYLSKLWFLWTDFYEFFEKLDMAQGPISHILAAVRITMDQYADYKDPIHRRIQYEATGGNFVLLLQLRPRYFH